MRNFMVKVTKVDDNTFRIYYDFKDCRISDDELMDLSHEIWQKSVYTAFLDSQYKDVGILILHCNAVLWRDSLINYGDMLHLVASKLHANVSGYMQLALELPDEFATQGNEIS